MECGTQPTFLTLSGLCVHTPIYFGRSSSSGGAAGALCVSWRHYLPSCGGLVNSVVPANTQICVKELQIARKFLTTFGLEMKLRHTYSR